MRSKCQTADRVTAEVLARPRNEETAWDRHESQPPPCRVGAEGLCCHVCHMGPCRILPSRPDARGVCGAGADLIVARNLARAVAAGAAAHSDHGRRAVQVLRATSASRDADVKHRGLRGHKLRKLAEEFHLPREDGSKRVADELASFFERQFTVQEGPLVTALRAPRDLRRRWVQQGVFPRGIDREIVELLHRTSQGVEADPIGLLRGALRVALADGWGGSMIATEVSDVVFGSPMAVRAQANLGVLEEREVNIIVHGYDPSLSAMVARASRDPELLRLAKDKGAKGINVAGLCCTANELLMRQGMPVVGNYLQQELAILTGAVDLMLVDLQCVMPSLSRLAACFHTLLVSTSPKATIPGAVRMEGDPIRSPTIARKIIALAAERFASRDPSRVKIPRGKMDLVAGFSEQNLPYYLSGRFNNDYGLLIEAIQSGLVRGVVGVVGCNNTRVTHDGNHLHLVRQLLKKDILVLQTGCSATASAKAGLMHPRKALKLAGPGLRELCEMVGIPPVLHLGSCVDNSRLIMVCTALARELQCEDLSSLPVAVAAPEAMSEKALSIGFYAVASGLFTVITPEPRIAGSQAVRRYLEHGIEKETGGSFLFTNDIESAATAITARLDGKRAAAGIAPMAQPDVVIDEAEAWPVAVTPVG